MSNAVPDRDVTTSDATLASARDRGREWVSAEMASDKNLSEAAAASAAGRTTAALKDAVKDRHFYVLTDNTGAVRYPSWQFDAPADMLRYMLGELLAAERSIWVVHAFLIRENSTLGGRTPAACIADPEADRGAILAAIKRRFEDDQGAG